MVTQPEELLNVTAALVERLHHQSSQLAPPQRAEIYRFLAELTEFALHIDERRRGARADFDPVQADVYMRYLRELSDRGSGDFKIPSDVLRGSLKRFDRANKLFAMRGGGARRWPP